MEYQKSTADVIGETADYLEKNGWWRGSLVGPNGRQTCVIGALMRSQHQDGCEADAKLCQQFADAIVGYLPPRVHSVSDWNDHHAKDKQEVLDLLRRVEKIERTGFDPEEGSSDAER